MRNPETSALGQIGVLLLRVYVGGTMAWAHGLAKFQEPQDFLSGSNMADFPAPEILGWAAIFGEFFGSIMLALGFLTRLSALALMGTMLGAVLIVHAGDEFRRLEKPLLYAAFAGFFLLYGGGRYSIDGLIRRFRRGA